MCRCHTHPTHSYHSYCRNVVLHSLVPTPIYHYTRSCRLRVVSLVSLLLRAFAHESLGTTHNLDTLLWTPGHIKVHVTFGERLVLGRTSANAAMPVISLARGPLAISVV